MAELETYPRPAKVELDDVMARACGGEAPKEVDWHGAPVLDFAPPSLDDAQQALQRLSDEAQTSLRSLFERVRKSETVDALSRTWEAVKQGLSREKTDWTFAINLTTDYGSGYGVEARMAELHKLAEKSRGKPVTLVVQAAMPDYQSPEAFASGLPDGHYLDRWVIKDGKMTWVESAKSVGLAKDTEDLLAFTGKRFDAKRLGLLLDSHGNGNLGLTGDTGRATVPEFAQALRNGLKLINRKSLDVLDFDCCLMAQNGVVNEVKDVTRNVVASAETEHIAGQELTIPLERIFENPGMTGGQVARDFIKSSRDKQATMEAVSKVLAYFGIDNPAKVPIKTLAHMSVEEYEGFRGSLDKFGDKMCDVLKDEANRAAIEDVIDDTATYGGGGGGFLFLFMSVKGDKYDLKDFTTRVVKAIDAGKIKDADGTLKACAEDVLAKRNKLVGDYFGHGNYAQLGGYSVFLPARDLREGTEAHVQREYRAQLVNAETGWGRFRHALRHQQKPAESDKPEHPVTKPEPAPVPREAQPPQAAVVKVVPEGRPRQSAGEPAVRHR